MRNKLRGNNKNKKIVKIGNTFLGTGNILVQSMTNTLTKDTKKTILQIKSLERAGCELVRSSIPDEESAEAIKIIKKEISIPLIADIHFDYKLAISAITNGADKIRINPGNIHKNHLREVIKVAKDFNIAIRIGVNTGSLRDIWDNSLTLDKKSDIMAKKALDFIEIFEQNNFFNLVVSLKSSNVDLNYLAYKKFSSLSDYPIHIGLTESGSIFSGLIKSSISLTELLKENIGDTIRVSLTADPLYEIFAAYNILNCLGIRKKYPEIISCPTCARTTINVIELVKEIENYIYTLDFSGNKILPIKIAVMGCVVNGPGEAKDADFAISGVGTKVMIFEKGNLIETFDKSLIKKKINVFLEKYQNLFKN